MKRMQTLAARSAASLAPSRWPAARYRRPVARNATSSTCPRLGRGAAWQPTGGRTSATHAQRAGRRSAAPTTATWRAPWRASTSRAPRCGWPTPSGCRRVDAGVSARRQRFSRPTYRSVGRQPDRQQLSRRPERVATRSTCGRAGANLDAAARDDLLASEYARDTLRTALAAQVVQSYAALQSLDAQLVLFERTVRGAARQPDAAAPALRRRRHLRARHPSARSRADRQRSAAAQARTRARRGRTGAGAGARPIAGALVEQRCARGETPPWCRQPRARRACRRTCCERRPDVQARRSAAARRRCARRRGTCGVLPEHHADRQPTAARAARVVEPDRRRRR